MPERSEAGSAQTTLCDVRTRPAPTTATDGGWLYERAGGAVWMYLLGTEHGAWAASPKWHAPPRDLNCESTRMRATEERGLGSQPTATEGGHDRASARRGQDVSDGRYASRMGAMKTERSATAI